MNAKADFQEILDVALPLAERVLREEGELIPFGVQLEPGRQAEFVAGDFGEERPESKKMMAFLQKYFLRAATQKKIVAAGICFMASVNVENGEKQDVVIFRMSHVSGEVIDVCLPYDVGTPGGVSFGTMFATKQVANFLVQCPS